MGRPTRFAAHKFDAEATEVDAAVDIVHVHGEIAGIGRHTPVIVERPAPAATDRGRRQVGGHVVADRPAGLVAIGVGFQRQAQFEPVPDQAKTRA